MRADTGRLRKSQKFFPSSEIEAQGEWVADSLKDYLQRHPEMDERCLKQGRCRFYTTESVEKFRESASIFLDCPIEVESIVLE